MNKNGSVLIIVLIYMIVVVILGGAFFKIATNDSLNTQQYIDDQKNLFLAEAGIQRCMWLITQDTDGVYKTSPYSGVFRLKGTGTAANELEDQDISINITYNGNNIYQITSSTAYGSSTKTITTVNEENTPAKVFDYAYFINNWGWFYGGPIYAYGDVRSNGRFDFKYGPTVEGDIYAGYEIGINGTVNGYGADPAHQHTFSEQLPMPNLNDLSIYEGEATGTIVINGSNIITGVHGDDVGENENITLIGTSTHPIEINGTVVVRGDVIVSGVITGQGTIYAGRNLYVPNNITYANGPTTNKPTYPGGSPPLESDVDSWVSDNSDKDLVGFAATESVILGDYTASSNQWIFNYYLYHMGDEDVGEDGIPDTSDTGENDGTFVAAYEDLDGDGVQDTNYTATDIATQTAITNFDNLPGGFSNFHDIVVNPDIYTPGQTEINGIFYTNHAMSGAGGGNVTVNGVIISKDEAIGISSIEMNYDWRVHSKYTSDGHGIISLPFTKNVEMLRWR